MAATTRAITPTPSGPFRSPSHTPDVSSTATSKPSSTQPAALPPVSAVKATGLSQAVPRTLSPEPLTGAAALEDQRRQREGLLAENPRQKSPNPANTVKSILSGAESTAMSRPADAPTSAGTPSTTSRPNSSRTPKVQIPEPVASDHIQASPTSITAVNSGPGDGVGTAPTATATEAATSGPVTVDKAISSEASLQQAASVAMTQGQGPDTPSSNRAMTFPAPQPPETERRQPPSRGQSLPNAGYGNSSPRSPSTKRHKCPFCDTDFTRHHNLKSHLLTHSQEKPYECPTCQARFRRLHDLKRHTKLHTGERPHTCPKCGRRFARGDALARHNKGPGGCAGRRSSFGLDDDGEGRAGEDIMDGVVYQGDGPDDDRMDEDGPPLGPDGRRVSEPSHKRNRSRQSSTHSVGYHPYSRTYPPIQPPTPGSSSRTLYPPHSGASASSRDPPPPNHTLSPKPAGSSLSSLHFAGTASGPGVFSHSGMTESPKPLSPGQTDTHHHPGHGPSQPSHLGLSGETSPATASANRNRSPSNSIHHQLEQYNRNNSLHPPPPHPGAPQLPSLPGLAPAPGPPASSLSMSKPGMPAPQPGSGSSAGTSGHGSVSSLRDIIGAPDPRSGEVELWNYVRELESRMVRMAKDHESRIGELRDEIGMLRRDLAAGRSGGH